MALSSKVEAALRRAHAAAQAPWCAYLYDLEALRRRARRLVGDLPANAELFYAIKANPEPPLLAALADVVHGFEVASGGELALVREQFPQVPVIFGGPGKTDPELAAAVDTRVQCLHVESASELERLAAAARAAGRSQEILLRINLPLAQLPATKLAMGGRPTPFGIDAAQLPACLDWLRSHPELRLQGFHFHLLSHQLNARAHVELLGHYFGQVQAWSRQYDLRLEQVNVGGGLGINYTDPERSFDWEAFCRGLREQIERHAMGGYRIRFELGRYLSAPCGYYAMEVLEIKSTFGHTFVVARGGTHHFRLPYAQGHSHPFHVLPVAHWDRPYPRQEASGPVTVVGQLCTPKDVLASEAPVERVRVGDLVVFPDAGAYAWHISHHDFLRHPHPDQLFLPVLVEETRHAANQ
jgi:diaminopimelate decarboxylase